MTERIEASPRFKARVAGLFELLEALTSGFGQVIVPGMLVVSGDAAATAANILAHELSFRLCFVAALIAVACHIAWTLLFYELFKPVNRSVSLLAAFLSLVAIAVQAFSSLFQLAGLMHPRLRTALLVRELLNKRGDRFDFVVGNLIPVEHLDGDINEVTKALEDHTVHALAADGDTQFLPLVPPAEPELVGAHSIP